jgi:hypothetical protein
MLLSSARWCRVLFLILGHKSAYRCSRVALILHLLCGNHKFVGILWGILKVTNCGSIFDINVLHFGWYLRISIKCFSCLIWASLLVDINFRLTKITSNELLKWDGSPILRVYGKLSYLYAQCIFPVLLLLLHPPL